MTAGIVEAINFVRIPGECEHGSAHDRYEIRVVSVVRAHTYWCSHPLCDDSPWAILISGRRRPEVKLTAQVLQDGAAVVALAYLLVIRDQGIASMHARIGICDQWEDPIFGNIGPVDGERLFTERYFAESGPGVYPAEIVTLG